jgi:hypothetical protein
LLSSLFTSPPINHLPFKKKRKERKFPPLLSISFDDPSYQLRKKHEEEAKQIEMFIEIYGKKILFIVGASHPRCCIKKKAL